MSYADALQMVAMTCPPEVLAALQQERSDLVREYLRSLGETGRLLEALQTHVAKLKVKP